MNNLYGGSKGNYRAIGLLSKNVEANHKSGRPSRLPTHYVILPNAISKELLG
eukprot:c41579_g1_i1 orf=189-344(+)